MASELTVQTLRGPTSGADADKVIIPSGQTLYAPGHVLQGVQGVGQNLGGTFTSQTFTATGVKVLITPTSTSSKIYVSGWCHVYKSAGTHYQCGLFRDGTNLTGTFGNGGSDNDGGTAHYDAPMMWIDSPNTTSEVTYEFYIRTRETATLLLNDNTSYTSNITALEIAG